MEKILIHKKVIGLLIVLALSYFAIKPLFVPGFFTMHDNTQVERVYEMGKALTDGMFPVRWVADFGYGYGYPIFNFYAPFAYYVGASFHLLGFDILNATKIMIGIGMILSGLFMYLLAREFWGEMGGIVAGLFYLYAPYHAVEVYVRGDIAEMFAYACIPLLFYGVWKTYKDQKFRYTIVGGVGFAAIILSHNLTAMMVTPFLIVAVALSYLLLQSKKKRLPPLFALAIPLFGILFAAFYWIPALSEMDYTNVLTTIGGSADFHKHFVCISQLWNSPWGFGGSAPGCLDGLSFRIGKLHIIFAVLSLFSLLLWKREKVRVHVILFSFLSLIVAVLLTLQISQPVWDSIPHMAFFQYPWRFLIVISFFASFLSGVLIWFIGHILRKQKFFRHVQSIVGLFTIASLLFYNVKLFLPQTILHTVASDYTVLKVLRFYNSQISDEYMPKNFRKPMGPTQMVTEKITPSGNIHLLSQIDKTQIYLADIVATQDTIIHINTAFFPAWQAFIDQRRAESWMFTPTNTGYNLSVPKGKHTISLRFIQTPIEKTANIVSLAGIFLSILGIIIAKKHKIA